MKHEEAMREFTYADPQTGVLIVVTAITQEEAEKKIQKELSKEVEKEEKKK